LGPQARVAQEQEYSELFEKFKEYAKKNEIKYTAFGKDMHFIVVADRKYEKNLRDFTQDMQFQGR